jgi:hypothetical protein
VLEDFLTIVDTGAAVLAVSLDLSAAFDLVHHPTLIKRLINMFGLSADAAELISSFLSNRNFMVSLNNSNSASTELIHGVPQGSIVGPLLFTAYVAPVVRCLEAYGLSYHYYADDFLIYGANNKNDIPATCNIFSACLNEVFLWFSANGMSVNPDKTDCLLVSTSQ